MARGSKAKYSSKQKRMAEHIEQSEKGRGKKTAERIAWATVNKQDGGAKGSGSKKAVSKRASPKTAASDEAPSKKAASKRSGAKASFRSAGGASGSTSKKSGGTLKKARGTERMGSKRPVGTKKAVGRPRKKT